MNAVWLTVFYISAHGLFAIERQMPSFDACVVELLVVVTPETYAIGVRGALCREVYVEGSA